MRRFKRLFKVKKPVIGMIHLDSLPGTPNFKGKTSTIIERAVEEAKVYLGAGIDSIAIENMHDLPYLKREVGHEISSIMSIVGYEIKRATKLPTGIQILAGANKEALAAANSAGLDFIRAEGFIYSHIADEGSIESDAGELLRYRKIIGAENILIFTDIKKKHSSHTITADIGIEDTALTAEFFMSDGVVITGKSTGSPADIHQLESVKKRVKLPVIVGSGVTIENVMEYYPVCDALIIGSTFKKGGNWRNEVDKIRVGNFMRKMRELREQI